MKLTYGNNIPYSPRGTPLNERPVEELMDMATRFGIDHKVLRDLSVKGGDDEIFGVRVGELSGDDQATGIVEEEKARRQVLAELIREKQREVMRARARMDNKQEIRKRYDDVWDDIGRAVENRDVERVIGLYGPLAVLVLGDLMVNGRDDGMRLSAAKEMMHMSQGKPVSRNVNLNGSMDTLDEKELDALIRSYMRERNTDKPLEISSGRDDGSLQ